MCLEGHGRNFTLVVTFNAYKFKINDFVSPPHHLGKTLSGCGHCVKLDKYEQCNLIRQNQTTELDLHAPTLVGNPTACLF